jgi:hypothetical protein
MRDLRRATGTAAPGTSASLGFPWPLRWLEIDRFDWCGCYPDGVDDSLAGKTGALRHLFNRSS